MIGEMEKAGLAYGHSGVGHESVSSLYCFPELPDSPVVAVFGRGTDEGVPEFEALNLALGDDGSCALAPGRSLRRRSESVRL